MNYKKDAPQNMRCIFFIYYLNIFSIPLNRKSAKNTVVATAIKLKNTYAMFNCKILIEKHIIMSIKKEIIERINFEKNVFPTI